MRYKLIIEYLGTHFSGWQVQPSARTVEGEIEKAFEQILQRKVDLIGQGRTDAGVHAIGQVAHVDLGDVKDPDKLIFGVNGLLGNEVHIHEIEQVEEDFHARFDAGSREYYYTICTKPSPLKESQSWTPLGTIDVELMRECAKALVGEYDFFGFSKFNEENYTTLCDVYDSEIEEREGELIYRIRANRFLRNMVRRLVGTMVEVGKGKLSVSEFKELLENPGSEVKTFTAPAKGLVLRKVFY